MICFIILHYIVEEETVSCVCHVKSLAGEKKIVVVDNCSPNQSGTALKTRYENDPEVDVLLNLHNDGFARGNNLGCRWAKEQYSPDFYVVMNNDIEIRQLDFIDRIQKQWEQKQFDVLGPDVYSTTGRFHQSPKSAERMSLEKARKCQAEYKKKINSKVIVPVRCCIKQIKPLQIIYNKTHKQEHKLDFNQEYSDLPLHGSCLVFSRHFMEKREQAFFSGTFFYFETEILDYECQQEGYKEWYVPSLKVFHHHNVATNSAYKDELSRVRFMNQQIYASISAFLRAYDN